MEVHTLQGMDLHLLLVDSSRFSVLYESALGRVHLCFSILDKEAGKKWISIPRYELAVVAKGEEQMV